jgi:hypothetical protein
MAYTTVNKPKDYFNTKIYTADQQANRVISGVGFQPDFVWLKNRDSAVTHDLYDAVRGATKALHTNSSSAETNQPDGLTAFNSDGFTVDTSWGNYATGNSYASWNWKANGSGSANTDGSINSTVSANTTSGFSIVSYTGNGTAGATIGHGLGTAPKVVLIKRRSQSGQWVMGHGSLGFTKFLELDLTGGAQTSSSRFNDTAPTNSVFTVGSTLDTNANGIELIAYCFSEVQGFSKMGSYTGNGSSSSGAFINTGMKPSFIMGKYTGGSGDWYLWDNTRLGYNPDNNKIKPNSNSTESTEDWIDIYSNGFKFFNNSGDFNYNGYNFVYLAFAEAPLVGGTGAGIPCTAR